ncbi:MAG: efflux RND transporter permease subunit, partial [Armatimonadetes bacterium]|nr:efflux RND transporter permease subunit [Armatimonadota bacterium]
EIQVLVDKYRLEAYGLTITDVVSAVYSGTANIPGGYVTEGPRDYDARLVGEFSSVDQLRAIRLPVRAGSGAIPLTLADVATVRDGVRDRDSVTRVWHRKPDGQWEGRDGVGIVITKLADANTIDVVDGVRAAIARIEKEMPGNLKFITAQDASLNIRSQLADINFTLFFGALLAVLVVFLFLHNLRGTIICATAIPASLIATFIPMYFLGQSLNSMTMLGLSLAVGILVDDSIVVLENIYRHLRRGEPPREAAFNGRTEIGLAAITITLVDVVVFLPMLWMGGIVGMFFRAFGLTVACSTLFSLLVSFTVTPWLASRWYRLGEDMERRTGVFLWLEHGYQAVDHFYRRVLGTALQYRWTVVLGGFGFLVLLILWIFPADGNWRIKIGYIPMSDQSQIGVILEMPEGSSLAETDRVLRQVEERITQIPEVKTMFATVGSIQGGARSSPERGRQFGQIQLQLVDKPDILHSLNPFANHTQPREDWRKRTDQEVAADIRQRTADIVGGRLVATPIRGFGGFSAPVQVELLGFDLGPMLATARQIQQRMAQVPGLINVDVSLRPGKPEAQIFIDRDRAAYLGLDVRQVGAAVRSAVEGNIDAKYREEGEQFDIRVRYRPEDRARREDLANLVVGMARRTDGQPGHPVYLKDVAHIGMGDGPTKIDRKNRLRKVAISAYLMPGVPAVGIMNQVNAAIADVPLGSIRMSVGGDLDRAKTEYPHMFVTLALSVMLVYLLMAVLFDNLLHPFTIQLSLPMALVGAFIALIITDQQITIISLTGFIMLAGIVQKNAILLIDYTNTLRARGYSRDAAIKEAGPTRLRPILMTTAAMVAGMMPVALAIGRASESRAPLGTVVIGGLVLSMLLTLLVIPCVYTLFDDALAWVARLVGWGKGQRALVENALTEEPPASGG